MKTEESSRVRERKSERGEFREREKGRRGGWWESGESVNEEYTV